MDLSGGSLTSRRLRSLRSLMVVNGLIGLVLVGASLTYDPTPARATLRWAGVVTVFCGLATLIAWADRSVARRSLGPRAVPAVAVGLGVLACVASVAASAGADDTLAFPVELMPASAVVVMGSWALLFSRTPPAVHTAPARPRTRAEADPSPTPAAARGGRRTRQTRVTDRLSSPRPIS